MVSIEASSNSTFPGSDINGDGHGDILWRNPLLGDTAFWAMAGATLSSVTFIEPDLTIPEEWAVVGVADFNSDGNSDLLWRNSTAGAIALWYLDKAGNQTGVEVLPLVIPGDWQIVGVGDFNSDQKTDVLWSNALSGSLAAWYMDGATLSGSEIFADIPLDWRVGGVGDFNDDGIDDVVWQNQISGEVLLSYSDGVAYNSQWYTGIAAVDGFASLPWEIRGTGDFNTDGNTDILWSNRQTGELATWYLQNNLIQGREIFAVIDPTWNPLSQVRGGRADLTVNSAVVPTSVVSGETVNVSVTVANQGSKTSKASTLKYYLSADATLDSNDTFLGDTSMKALLAGESATMQGSFTYNAAIMGAVGTKYLFLVADANSSVNESNEQNNVFSQALNVVEPTPLKVDLTPENANIPEVWTVGKNLSLSVDVVNQGSERVGSSSLYVYLLDGDTFDPKGAGPGVILSATVEALESGGRTTKTLDFTYLASFGTGQKYLYFVTDGDGLFTETNEDNNVISKPVNVASIEQSIDYIITSATAPTNVVIEQPITLSVTVKNQGDTPAPGTTVKVYLTNYTGPNDKFELTASPEPTFVTDLTVPALDGNGSTTIDTNIAYSTLWGSGQKNVFFVVDLEAQVKELNEQNNIAKASQVLTATPPDDVNLLVRNITLSPNSIIPGGSINITATVENTGTVSTNTATSLKLYLSDDDTLDSNDEELIGLNIMPLAGGGSQTRTYTYQSFSTDLAGTKYILFKADANNSVFETSEDNFAAKAFTINEVKPGTDLLISNASVSTTTLRVGDSLTVNATMQNQGQDPASSKLGIYASSDATFDQNDRLIDTFDTGNLATYATFSKHHTFTYLEEYGTGTKYILVVADPLVGVSESNETNNVQAFAITAAPDPNRPDLVMGSIVTDSRFFADLNFGIQFNYFVKNQGLRETTAPFTIRFYLSDEIRTSLADLEANALLLGNSEEIPPQSDWAGSDQYEGLAGFMRTNFESNPNYSTRWSAGARYLIAVVDYGNGISESDESNNIFASASFTLQSANT
ncbi:MAG: hypothetical protein RLZZ597_1131 [Cyanobacteriota bacterium]|jgi:subtilase family serine protease